MISPWYEKFICKNLLCKMIKLGSKGLPALNIDPCQPLNKRCSLLQSSSATVQAIVVSLIDRFYELQTGFLHEGLFSFHNFVCLTNDSQSS